MSLREKMIARARQASTAYPSAAINAGTAGKQTSTVDGAWDSGEPWKDPADAGTSANSWNQSSGGPSKDSTDAGTLDEPFDDEVETLITHRCKFCKAHGHWANDCPQKKGSDKCYNCGETGH